MSIVQNKRESLTPFSIFIAICVSNAELYIECHIGRFFVSHFDGFFEAHQKNLRDVALV